MTEIEKDSVETETEQAATRQQKDWIDSYLSLVEKTEPPRIFHLWTAISVVAAALQRKCFVEWGLGLTFYPNLYIVLVGPPASRKGTALKLGYYFLDKAKIKCSANSTSRQALIKEIQQAKRTVVLPQTGESFEHSSLTIYSEEFTVLIGYNDNDFITWLNDWFDCGIGPKGTWRNNTIAHSMQEITGIWVNIIGGTTEMLLKAALPFHSSGGGFNSRVVYVNVRDRCQRKPRPQLTDSDRLLTLDLVNDLKLINEMAGSFVWTKDFETSFTKWYETCDQVPHMNAQHFQEYLGRRQVQLMKLVQISSASRSNDMVLEQRDFDRALGWLIEAEKEMDGTAIGRFEFADVLRQIQEMVALRKSIPFSDIMQAFAHDVDKKTLEGLCETLAVMKKINYVFKDNQRFLEVRK